jgi:hypothetical protein
MPNVEQRCTNVPMADGGRGPVRLPIGFGAVQSLVGRSPMRAGGLLEAR